ncbi:DUF6255 family natural product biosynthesis protein [Streptomyces roseifaciens]
MTVRRICTHRGGWSARTRGEARCRDCGTVRFTEYAALRPPGLPHPPAPPRPLARYSRWCLPERGVPIPRT